jgi:hypothetical protein
MVRDKFYFGDDYHTDWDAFNFTFGCVSKETRLFYDQKADGILGMGTATDMSVLGEVPIY